jgi:2-polyprenyl-3-methyl-5-hydroxy-6-metoxy-1,4-benzoquinol methylase
MRNPVKRTKNKKDYQMEKPELRQRGRASIDFHNAVRSAAQAVQRQVERELAEAGVTAQTMPEDMDERHGLVDQTLAQSRAYGTRALLTEWTAKDHGPICQAAFGEMRDELEPMLRSLDEGATTLDASADIDIPRYFSQTWFHRTTGGWDASEFNGYVHGELIHKLILTKAFGNDILAQRRQVAAEAPRDHYDRILDIGASSGFYTQALAQVYPQAQITGVDLSVRMLEHARRLGNEAGHAWTLLQRAGEDTGFADASFDLVTSFNVVHEVPPRITRQMMEEAMRLLAPGGDMLMCDTPRYADIDKMASWRFDWYANAAGEPFWRAAANLDLAQMARDAGFVDVEAYGLNKGAPYLVRGRKPEAC